MKRPYCFIDDCRNLATLIVESYPDNEYLCDEHRWLYEPEPWDVDVSARYESEQDA